MHLSLKKRIQGNLSFSPAKSLAYAVAAATIIVFLSLLLVTITATEQLSNADLWLTMVSHYVFMTWSFYMEFLLFRVCSRLRTKLLLSFALVLVGSPLVGLAVTVIQMWIHQQSEYSMEGRLLTMSGTAISDGLTAFIVSILIYWHDSYDLKNKENERLKIDNLNARIDALKKQLSPHFLFNSLNTLRGLIGPENKDARQYVDGMAQVYRYTIQDRDIVHLKDEMDFVSSYVLMLQKRYGQALIIKTDCSSEYDYRYILPMSIQILVENAVKHNIIMQDIPLTVNIYTTEDEKIVVRNRITPRDNDILERTGTGLTNLFERYRLRFMAPVEIDTSDGFFTVSIPLFKTDTNKSK